MEVMKQLLVSRFAGLTYELTGTKQLTLIFGVSYAAISTVLATFMCGLALGHRPAPLNVTTRGFGPAAYIGTDFGLFCRGYSASASRGS